MAVYGNQLLFFSEQFRLFPVYTMNPLPSGSYTKRKFLGKVKGVFQFVKRGNLTRENDAEADVNVPVLWTRTKMDINKNLFVVHDDILYRIKGGDNWKYEGGFYSYLLEVFIGNSDVQKPTENVNLGVYE